jgi:hypothetical protein
MDVSGFAAAMPDFLPQERRGWIYLLQEKHEYLRGTTVYKVGKTASLLYEPFNRLAHYRGGVDLHMMIQVPLEKLDAVETDIKLYFERVFGPPVSGTESFAGDLQEMRRIVGELCLDAFTWPGGIIQGLLRGSGAGSAKKGTTIHVEKTDM